MHARRTARRETVKSVKKTTVKPAVVNEYLESVGSTPIKQGVRISKLALRPEVNLENLLKISEMESLIEHAEGLEAIVQMVEIDLKYQGYIERENELIKKMERLEGLKIPLDFNYQSTTNITIEAREKLSKIRPGNLGQASRISGVSPADVSVLMILLKSGRVVKNGASES